MLATMKDSVREYAYTVGREKPLVQWILTDYDTWEHNPHYVGPDQGHPEYCDPICTVWATFAEAAEEARRSAAYLGHAVEVSNYKDRCWVVYY